ENDRDIIESFVTGQNAINSISTRIVKQVSRAFLFYVNTNSRSVILNYGFIIDNFTVRGSSEVLDGKIDLEARLNYINSIMENQNASSWYNSPMFGLYLLPMGDDMSKYSPNGGGVWDERRHMYVQNWPYIKNEHSSNQNPYWVTNRLQN